MAQREEWQVVSFFSFISAKMADKHTWHKV